MRSFCCALGMLLLAGGLPLHAETVSFHVHVEAGPLDRRQAVVRVPLKSRIQDRVRAEVSDAGGRTWPAQVIAPSPLQAGDSDREPVSELVFILPELDQGVSLDLKATVTSEGGATLPEFQWKESGPGVTDLEFDGRPVLRSMHPKLDESTPEKRGETYKPYHHVFDPRGKTLLTKGPGGLFPHHRGLFFGFNRISYGDGKTADTWHCNKGEYQSHEEVVLLEAGPVLGRQVSRIAWHGQDRQVFAEELRELTAYHTPGGLLIEFGTRLRSLAGKVRLDGDPQHAGFQFRATQEVPDKTAAQTYYLRPDGRGEPGKFRNWPDDKSHVNLPWHALSFVVGSQRYTCCYLDRPQNPKESRFSERDYGRFGSYFEYNLDTDHPLNLRYRIWLQEGEMEPPQVQSLADEFVHPVAATLR